MMNTLLLAMMAVSSPPQDDFWMNRFNDANQAGINTALTTMNNDMVRRSAERHQRRSTSSAASSSRSRATCANARRMVANGDRRPKMQTLLDLCARGGF